MQTKFVKILSEIRAAKVPADAIKDKKEWEKAIKEKDPKAKFVERSGGRIVAQAGDSKQIIGTWEKKGQFEFGTLVDGKKRGAAKKDERDDDGTEGKREVELIAYVTDEDGKDQKYKKKLGKNFDVEKIEKAKKDFEQELYKKYGYDIEVLEIEANIGGYADTDSANNYQRDETESHSIHF